MTKAVYLWNMPIALAAAMDREREFEAARRSRLAATAKTGKEQRPGLLSRTARRITRRQQAAPAW